MNKKRKIILCGAAVLVAGGVLAGVAGRRGREEAGTGQAAMTELVKVEKQNLIDSVSVTGTVESADSRDVSASAKDVKVLAVNYKVGDYVNAGDVVAVLDSSDLERKLKEAKNSQALSEYTENKKIETASESYAEAVEDGTDDYNKAVKSEAEAKEDLQEAEGDLSEAASRLKRREERVSEANQALEEAVKPQEPEVPEGGAEDPAYQEAVLAWQEALAAYEELERAAEEASVSYTEAHQAYQAASEAEEKAVSAYETASETLADAQKKNDRNITSAADNLEKAQAEHTYSNDSSQQTIENYEEQIGSCTVTAPISGVITAINVDVGDSYMGEGNALFTVADQEHFIVSANVDEYDISSIGKDMTAAVIVEAVGEEELPAAVSFVAPTATDSGAGSAAYRVEIGLDDANTELRIGMTAKASIVKNAVYDVLTVPYDCVETDEEGNSCIYVDQNGEKVSVPVEVGMQGDYYVEISSDAVSEDTMVYYSTPMLNGTKTSEGADGDEVLSMPMDGGPAGGSRGGPEGPGGF